MYSHFAVILICVLFAIGFVSLNLFISKLLSPKNPLVLKSVPYECGEVPKGSPLIQFNPRYYVFALAFLIFDVEIIFLYPCALVFKQWIENDMALMVLFEMLLFVLVLFFGLVYLWKNKDLEWVKTIEKDDY